MKTNDPLLERVRRSNPISPTAFQDLASTPEGAATLEAILADHGSSRETSLSVQPPTLSAWTDMRKLTALGTVLVVAISIVFVIGANDRQEHDRDLAWGAELVLFAERSPRLLLEGWSVTRADERDGNEGEMTFERDGLLVDLHWRPVGTHRSFVEDRTVGSERSWDITVMGQPAKLFLYAGTSHYTALWLHRDHSLELRPQYDLPSEGAFGEFAATLHHVDVDTWLSAMPASVVKPDSRAAAVEQMLEEIPVPDALDVSELKQGQLVSDEYQLGAQVTGAVACAWIEQWVEAGREGQQKEREEAVDALASARKWDVLHAMVPEGDWSVVLWDYADAIVANPSGGAEIVAGYKAGLGCT